MKILITGGCGFLGSNLAAEALRRGDELVVFDNLSRYGSAENLSWLQSLGPLTYFSGDIRNRHDVDQVVSDQRPEAVFHLAGQVAMTVSVRRPRLDFETNVLGTFQLLQAMREFSPQAALLYSSSNKVYGDLEQYRYREAATRYECVDRPDGFDESTPLDFHSPYGCSKGAADQFVLDAARTFGMNTVVFRHSSMYGGRQFATFDQGWVGWFCEQALRTRREKGKHSFTVSGNGKQVRDVLHARDVVALYFAALERIGTVRGHAFNIGGGMSSSLSLLELFSLLDETVGVRLRYEQLPPRHSDQRVFVADIRKAQGLLAWTPQVSPRAGIRQLLDWLASRSCC